MNEVILKDVWTTSLWIAGNCLHQAVFQPAIPLLGGVIKHQEYIIITSMMPARMQALPV